MKRFILPLLLAAISLTTLVACGGSNSPLGKLPDIMADAVQQYEELKEDAKNAKDKSAKSFEKMMSKDMKIRNNAAKKVEKEGKRLLGRTIPCVGGDEAYDFIKIKEAVIESVSFDRFTAVVRIKFIPDEGNVASSSNEHINYVFLDKDGKKILKGYTSAPYLTGTINLGRLSGVPPERWKDLKEIRFLTKDGAEHF